MAPCGTWVAKLNIEAVPFATVRLLKETKMNKLLLALLSSAMLITLCPSLSAAEKDTRADSRTQTQPNNNENQGRRDGDRLPAQSENSQSKEGTPQAANESPSPSGAGGAPGKSDAEKAGQSGSNNNNGSSAEATQSDTNTSAGESNYSAELKKCDALAGSDKTNCVTAAKKKQRDM
jgi:hypothetical protein